MNGDMCTLAPARRENTVPERRTRALRPVSSAPRSEGAGQGEGVDEERLVESLLYTGSIRLFS